MDDGYEVSFFLDISKHLIRFGSMNPATQENSEMILDTNLDFEKHLEGKHSKTSKTIELRRIVRQILPRPPMVAIYKSFIGPYFEHADIIYNKAYKASFHQN